MPSPLINGSYLLQKFPGKGGWTYAAIPEIVQDKCNPFGWVKVSGTIDGYVLKQYKLMPMGEGKLFLPVKAEIRKRIGKQAGDMVHIILYPDVTPLEIPEELIACFQTESFQIYDTFLSFTEGERKAYLDWIYDAKTEETKVERITKMMDRLHRKLKYRDKD
jgi:hypothetical protein